VKIWSLNDKWRETDKIQRRFYKKVLWTPRFVANRVAEFEMGRNSRRGKV
jgi:hypothetical protein